MRLDVEILGADGTFVNTMPDVRFDPADRAVYACCEGDLARRTVGTIVVDRSWSNDRGERRLLAELTTQGELER
ncbi:hypothetical protein [Sandaracinus amylolyticus]|uniref:Uncharacterized protein n=1 Tax=Sandaracinus amylolyticus TaxID=927083 RepID=A0A0F6YFG8_9BACT|nr:hypothetical protein [Sandaracinus amylolyticus]AKF03647.1 hypothetical protein DB32_000796 [Sandaracinus amylolyticus]